MKDKTKTLNKLVQLFPDNFGEGFAPHEWLDDETGNFILSDGGSNYSLFEKEEDGVYSGHYYFLDETTPTREKIKIANEMIDTVFSQYKARLIVGLTPLNNRPALLFNKWLGFQRVETVTDEAGQKCGLFKLTKNKRFK